jgi:heptaprenyl diphosphate synthase
MVYYRNRLFIVGGNMVNRNSIFGIVENDLATLEIELLSVIHSPVELIKNISEHLVQAGGKRLRPALYFLCSRIGQAELTQVMPMAVAIELIHMATLVHDDVIDTATTRRGKATANACWGNNLSVLTGDYLFAKAFSIVTADGNSQELKILTDVICAVCEGEIIQNKDTFNPDQSEQEYLIRIAKKTADFIAASCQLGGMVAGLTAVEVEALQAYGYAIGMAFQVTDDILDITASAEQIGKPVGNDLRQGVVTLPVIYALEHSADRNELRQIIVERDMSEQKIKRGLAIVHDTDAIEYSYQRVADYLKQARNVLPAACNGKLREALLSVADFVGLRKY